MKRKESLWLMIKYTVNMFRKTNVTEILIISIKKPFTCSKWNEKKYAIHVKKNCEIYKN